MTKRRPLRKLVVAGLVLMLIISVVSCTVMAQTVSELIRCAGVNTMVMPSNSQIANTATSLPSANENSVVDKNGRVLAEGKPLTDEKLQYAKIIGGVAFSLGLGDEGAILGITTAYQESTLVNSTVARDKDSLGLFQQRPSQGWGSASQITDPVYAANKFYAAMMRMVPNWRQLAQTPEGMKQVALTVQRPRAGVYDWQTHRFINWVPMATELVRRMHDATPLSSTTKVVPPPVAPPTATTSTDVKTGTIYLNHSVGTIPPEGIEVGASTFGGFYDRGGFFPSNDVQGRPSWHSGIDDNGKGNTDAGIVDTVSYAELSIDTHADNNDALGRLPNFTKLEITYNGRSVIAEKRDQGSSYANRTVGGKRISIDIWWQAAKLLDLRDGNAVVRLRPVDPRTPTTKIDGTAMIGVNSVNYAGETGNGLNCNPRGGDSGVPSNNPNTGANNSGLPAEGGSKWVSPLAVMSLGSGYGERFHPILKVKRLHDGDDLSAQSGDPIRAMQNGTITEMAYEANGAGNYLRIDYGAGNVVTYMHMSRYAGVQAGQSVVAGQVVGYVGSTGLSVSPHLHVMWHVNGKSVDPLPQFCRRGISVPGDNGCSSINKSSISSL